MKSNIHSRTRRWSALLAAALFSVALLVSSFSGGQAAYPAQEGTPYESALAATTLYLPLIRTGKSCANLFTFPGENLWNMTNIKARAAWDTCVLGEGVIVAVIDTGVDVYHTDLYDNLLSGIDYVDSDYDPSDMNGHGTHVSGIVGASLNNYGVLGAAPSVKILPIRVLDAEGNGYDSDVASGIYYAVSHGAKVINLSLSGAEYSNTLYSAVQYALSQGVVIVAAAGNNQSSLVNYPASFPNVISVAAVDASNLHAWFSNYNAYVDISAPGVNVYSTYFGNAFKSMNGTSMATPHVAGVAALVLSKFPNATPAQVTSAIQNTALDLGALGRDIYFGYGLLDAGKAVAYLGMHAAEVESQAEQVEAEAAPAPEQREASFQAGRVLVQFVPGQERTALAGLEGVSEESSIDAVSVKVLRVPPGREWETIDRLRESGKVIFAEPDYIVKAE